MATYRPIPPSRPTEGPATRWERFRARYPIAARLALGFGRVLAFFAIAAAVLGVLFGVFYLVGSLVLLEHEHPTRELVGVGFGVTFLLGITIALSWLAGGES